MELKDLQDQDWKAAEVLYLESFPPDERREWLDLISKAEEGGPIRLLGLYRQGNFVGFLTLWQLDGFYYIEHFAVQASMRGQGTGAWALGELQKCCKEPIVVEVERANEGKMAQRRIAFYERCGFAPYEEYDYIQPPYTPSSSPVPLMLMSTRPLAPANIDRQLSSAVYGAQH